VDIYDFFLDYCKHFDIEASSGQDTEQKYDRHFDQEWKTRNCSGYKIIEHLHSDSPQTAFVESRAKFDVEYIHQPVHSLSQIENSLKNEETLISVAVKESCGVHAYCGGFDNQGFYMIETRRVTKYKTGINRILNIQCLGALQDSLLILAHPTSGESSSADSSRS
jgi:hypothetical protein